MEAWPHQLCVEVPKSLARALAASHQQMADVLLLERNQAARDRVSSTCMRKSDTAHRWTCLNASTTSTTYFLESCFDSQFLRTWFYFVYILHTVLIISNPNTVRWLVAPLDRVACAHMRQKSCSFVPVLILLLLMDGQQVRRVEMFATTWHKLFASCRDCWTELLAISISIQYVWTSTLSCNLYSALYHITVHVLAQMSVDFLNPGLALFLFLSDDPYPRFGVRINDSTCLGNFCESALVDTNNSEVWGLARRWLWGPA